jgi:hypothetical protein
MGKEGKHSKQSSAPRSSSGTGAEDNKSWGLLLSIQKQLISDIEANGGLASSLDQICGEKEDIYGLPHSKHRRKVQNVVKYWRSLTAKAFAAKRQSIISPTLTGSLPTPPKTSRLVVQPFRRSTLSSSTPTSQPRRLAIMDDFDIPFASK